MCVLPRRISVPNVYRADRGQKESDTLKLELQTAVNHYVGGGIEPGTFARAASALKC